MRERLLRLGAALAPRLWWALVVGAVVTLGYLALDAGGSGPAQPLPFSHRLHAGDKQISCLFCHSSADRSSVAGVPEVAKCLLCHNVIATGFEPIQELRRYAQERRPVSWVRVYRLPDFAFFDHRAHVAHDVDCGVCHGDVQGMDRVKLNQRLNMGWCVDCHRQPEYGVSVDCAVCHR